MKSGPIVVLALVPGAASGYGCVVVDVRRRVTTRRPAITTVALFQHTVSHGFLVRSGQEYARNSCKADAAATNRLFLSRSSLVLSMPAQTCMVTACDYPGQV